jgi:hypothetical protein
MNNLVIVLLVVVGVVVLGVLMRRTSGEPGAEAKPDDGDDGATAVAGPEVADEPAEEEEEDLDPEHEAEELAMTADGRVFVELQGRAHAMMFPEARAAFASGVASWGGLRRDLPGARLVLAGAFGTGLFDLREFTAGRVKADAEGGARLELLGRDREYSFHLFDAPDAARVALEILRRTGTLRDQVEDDPESAAASDAAFDEARRAYEEEAIPDQVFASGAEVGDPEATDEADEAVSAPAGAETVGDALLRTEPPAGQRAVERDTTEPLPSPEGREWLATQLRRLVERAGPEPFLCAPLVTPSDQWFPDAWSPDAGAAQRVAARFFGYARLVENSALVEIVDDERDPQGTVVRSQPAARFCGFHDTVGLFSIARAALVHPPQVVAHLAHETAHAWRVAKGLVEPDARLEEALTDLTTIYLGVGILAANGSYVVEEPNTRGETPAATRWAHEHPGHLSPQAMCYLLALQAVTCGIEVQRYERWLEPTQVEFFAAAHEELEAAETDWVERLGLPPADDWPEPWGTPS